jgi:hypothetical protein
MVNDMENPCSEKKVDRKKGCPQVLQTLEGGVLLLQNIIRKFNIMIALNEVICMFVHLIILLV